MPHRLLSYYYKSKDQVYCMQKDPKKLLEKYKAGNCTEKEKAIVESWYLELQLRQQAPPHAAITHSKKEVWRALSANKEELPAKRGLRRIYILKIAACAAVFFIAVSGVFVYLNDGGEKPAAGISKRNDIAPGGNKAFLTLADGRKISLSDAANGEIAEQAGLTISKTADGQLVYTVADNADSRKEGAGWFNTIETPNGGKYQINLPDGTRVWLNAASSLRYPAKFTGNTRSVVLRGEGYFEVAKNPDVPFIVKTENQEVEVLGTHFNINSYKDEEDIETTLLEGSVRVIPGADHKKVILKPGEQSRLNKKGIDVKAVNIETVLAWKDGDFIFDGDDLKSIMRKIARWYDVEVIYKGDFDNLKFGGLISRSKNISSVLGIMESTGSVHFTIEGRRVTVLNNANN